MEAIPGYLSLHQTADLMTLKWTPNQLMNGNVGELDSEKRLVRPIRTKLHGFVSTLLFQWFLFTYLPFSVYWDYAMTIRLEEIVYLHCHQQGTVTPSYMTVCRGV